jgi:hypothetical protein
MAELTTAVGELGGDIQDVSQRLTGGYSTRSSWRETSQRSGWHRHGAVYGDAPRQGAVRRATRRDREQ